MRFRKPLLYPTELRGRYTSGRIHGTTQVSSGQCGSAVQYGKPGESSGKSDVRMKRIWCAISSHGFGHAAQAVPVLNELGRRVSGLTAILRTSVPARLFEADLQIAWEVSPAEQDVGCVQHGPIRIDVAATWGEHRRFHEQWEAKVAAEVRAIRSGKPALVLADISYLAIEAAARAGVPAVGLCNLSWDGVLKLLQEPGRHEQVDVIRRIQESYSLADLMRSEEHTSELQSRLHLVCRLLLEKKNTN